MWANCRAVVISVGALTASSTAWSTRKARCSNSRSTAIKAETRRRWLRGAAIDKMPKVEVHVVQSPEAPTASAGVAPVGQRRYRADSPAGAAESWRTASGDDQPCRPDPIKTNRPSVAIFCGEHHATPW